MGECVCVGGGRLLSCKGNQTVCVVVAGVVVCGRCGGVYRNGEWGGSRMGSGIGREIQAQWAGGKWGNGVGRTWEEPGVGRWGGR